MSREYYGATASAMLEVNAMLSINATGIEQDWEFEFADPERIGEILDTLELNLTNIDVRAALCLLMLSSVEAGLEAGEFDPSSVARAKDALNMDAEVLSMMRYYWLELRRTNHPEVMGDLLSMT